MSTKAGVSRPVAHESAVRRTIACFALLFAALCVVPVWAPLEPSESDAFNGHPAPAISFGTFNRGTVSLADYRGRPVVLNFFASWCPPCRAEISQLEELRARYVKAGLEIIGAATDAKLIPDTSPEKERSDVADIVRRLEIPYPVGIAPKPMTNSYSFIGLPTTIVIGRDGRIRKTATTTAPRLRPRCLVSSGCRLRRGACQSQVSVRPRR